MLDRDVVMVVLWRSSAAGAGVRRRRVHGTCPVHIVASAARRARSACGVRIPQELHSIRCGDRANAAAARSCSMRSATDMGQPPPNNACARRHCHERRLQQRPTTPSKSAFRPASRNRNDSRSSCCNDDYYDDGIRGAGAGNGVSEVSGRGVPDLMQVHVQGSGLAGVYPWEVAETKVETVTSMARHAGFPLRATIEEE